MQTPDQERISNVERAIQIAALVIARESARRPSAKLGFAHVNYGRLFIRDRWTLFAIARELNCDVADLLSPPSPAADSGTRWSTISEAAERLFERVQALSSPVRAAMRLRAGGIAWSAVARATPGRVMFSLMEDTDQGYLILARECEDEVDLLARYHDPRLMKKSIRRGSRKIMLSTAHHPC